MSNIKPILFSGPGAWDANPWVSVTIFKVHRCNVDEFLARRPETADVRAHPA